MPNSHGGACHQMPNYHGGNENALTSLPTPIVVLPISLLQIIAYILYESPPLLYNTSHWACSIAATYNPCLLAPSFPFPFALPPYASLPHPQSSSHDEEEALLQWCFKMQEAHHGMLMPKVML